MQQLFLAGARGAFLFLLFCGLFTSVCGAATLAGVSFPPAISVQNSEILLNGLGTREATIFKVDVYVMALYLEEKSHDPAQIIQSAGAKRIVMHFLRAVDAEKLREGWSKGFAENSVDLSSVAEQLAAFQSSMTDVEKGERIILDFVGENVVVDCAAKGKAEIAGRAFQQALLAVWLGPNPPNAKLKKDILGQ